jgi:parallel beta-helix repeat protein
MAVFSCAVGHGGPDTSFAQGWILLGHAQSRVRTGAGGFSGDTPRPPRWRLAFVLAVIVSSAGIASSSARAMNTCTNPITACPCAIKSAGDYTVSGPGLLAAPPGDCIHVNVPGVTLDLGSATISSSPSATADIGVYVLANAAGAVVKGTLNAPATVTGFTNGIRIDAPSATLENVVAQSNSVGIRITGGSAYGSALAVHNSSVTGILISGPAPGPYLTGVSVDSTLGFAGIELNGVHGAFLTNLTVTSSQTYGVWLLASSRNVIANFSVSRNTNAGIYLGCFRSGGILGKACTIVPSPPPSNGNILTSVNDPSTADGPSQPQQAYGVAIAAGNIGNRIVGIAGSGNGNGSFGADALDGNPNCGSNVWTANQFAIVSPSTCIH